MRRAYLGIFAAFLALLAAGHLFALPSNATVSSVGTPVTLPRTISALASVYGGNVTNLPLSINSTTLHWQGFYGNVSGNISLSAGTKALKTWAISNLIGQVYASTSPNVDFSAINSTAVTLANVDLAFPFLSGSDDSAANTGVPDANSEINISSYRVPANTRPVIYSRDISGAASWQQVVLAHSNPTAKDSFVFASIIRNNSLSFNGNLADFQAVVPTDATGDATAETYYFYGELR